jgi:hypothetical protein
MKETDLTVLLGPVRKPDQRELTARRRGRGSASRKHSQAAEAVNLTTPLFREHPAIVNNTREILTNPR